MEQSYCVSSPCQVSNANDVPCCEDRTLLEGPFETHKYSDKGKVEIIRTMGFLNERRLNDEESKNTFSKGKDCKRLIFLQSANNKL